MKNLTNNQSNFKQSTLKTIFNLTNVIIKPIFTLTYCMGSTFQMQSVNRLSYHSRCKGTAILSAAQ